MATTISRVVVGSGAVLWLASVYLSYRESEARRTAMIRHAADAGVPGSRASVVRQAADAVLPGEKPVLPACSGAEHEAGALSDRVEVAVGPA